MIDIHTHILANIDDGPVSIETSILMIKEEIKDGVETIVLTPHFIYRKPYPKAKLIEIYDRFIEKTKHLPVKIILGAEVYYHEKMEKIYKDFTFSGTNTLLLEFSLRREIDMEEALHELIVSGFQVIVAHPERYSYIKWAHILAFKSMGVFLQVNTNSLLGKNGRKIKLFARRMLKNKMIDFIATDAHNMNKRKPNLGKCYKFVKKKMGVKYADDIFKENPKRILI